MDKLLFTGGTGFLGRNVMPLLQEEYDVTTCGITVDDNVYANLAESVPDLPNKYDIVQRERLMLYLILMKRRNRFMILIIREL